MKKTYFLNIQKTVLGALFIAAASVLTLSASESPKDKMKELLHSYPYAGLIAKEITYGPITLRDLDLDGNGKVVFATPGEVIEGTVRYKVDAKQLESWHLHHVIVGIKGQDAQTCITHILGVWDSKGKASFNITAPLEKGVYELRFDYSTALTCDTAIDNWKEDAPSSQATVGIIVVE